MSRWDLFVWLVAPGGALAAASATTVCALKGRRVLTAVGAGASMLSIWVMISSWSVDSAAFEDLGLVAAYMFGVVPLTLVTLAGAIAPGRPGSWWDRAHAQRVTETERPST